MKSDILAVPQGRRWVLRPLSVAGGMFLSEGGEQRQDGSLVVTPGDYEFLVRRAAELGLEIAATNERDPLEWMDEGNAVLIRWPGDRRPVHYDPPKSVEGLIGESLRKRRD